MKLIQSTLALSMVVNIAAARAAESVAPAEAKPAGQATLVMYPQFMAGDFFVRNWMKTVPHQLRLGDSKPEAIVKEPEYKGKPLYGSLQFGAEGAAKPVSIVMDDDADAIFIDANQDGDLTNDPGVRWDKVEKTDEKTSYSGSFTFPAAWDSGPGKYGIKLYRAKGSSSAGWQTVGAPTGAIAIDGKDYRLYVYDGAGNGLFNNKLDAEKRQPATSVYVDVDDDGFWRPIGHAEATEIGKPIQIGQKWYSFQCSADGRQLTAFEAEAPAISKTPPVKMKGPGDKAPDFEMILTDGTTARLSDYKGKVVLLDFWATWCGPCMAAMPKVEELWQAAKTSPDVAFVGLCVSDQKSAFDKWINGTGTKYTFTFGFDPAGRDAEGKGQSRVWGVSGIPTTFIIDREGTIVEAVSGFTPANEERVVKALEKLGVKTH